jgi:formiminoglutamase
MVREKFDEILNFFEPVLHNDFSDSSYLNDTESMGNVISINYANNPLQHDVKTEIAIFTVNPPNNTNVEVNDAPKKIREEFYRLVKISSGIKITDFGNLRTGKNLNETLFAVQEVCALFFQQNIKVLIVGGPKSITSGVFRALKEFENNINFLSIDPKIDWFPETSNNVGLLSNIARNESAHLYNIACIAYQSYLVQPLQLKALKENHFEHYRLGELRNDFTNVEPAFRDADLVSFSISALRMGDAPAQADGSPNGLYSDEACRLARYAGISDRVKAFGIYDVDEKYDNRKQTSKLAAQIIWYYLEGYKNRQHDYPDDQKDNCTKYVVHIDEIDFPIVFLKNNHSNRWWIEVIAMGKEVKPSESLLVSCTETDYQTACQNEIPDRWWLNFKKMK